MVRQHRRNLIVVPCGSVPCQGPNVSVVQTPAVAAATVVMLATSKGCGERNVVASYLLTSGRQGSRAQRARSAGTARGECTWGPVAAGAGQASGAVDGMVSGGRNMYHQPIPVIINRPLGSIMPD